MNLGEVILPYLAPDPSRGSGMHRFIFSLYMQKSAFGDADCDASRRFFTQRKGIRSYEWVMMYRDQLFTVPVALAAFTSQHEDDYPSNINNSTPPGTPTNHHLTTPSATPPWSPTVRRPYSRDKMHLFRPSTTGFSPLNRQQHPTSNNQRHHFPSSQPSSFLVKRDVSPHESYSSPPLVESTPNSPSLSYLRDSSSSSIKAPPLTSASAQTASLDTSVLKFVSPTSEAIPSVHSVTTVQHPLRNTTSNIGSYIGYEEKNVLHSQATTAASSSSSVVENTFPLSDYSRLTSREMHRKSDLLKEWLATDEDERASDQRLTDDLSLLTSSRALRGKQHNTPSQISDGSVESMNNHSITSSLSMHNHASSIRTSSDRTSGSLISNLVSSVPSQSDLTPSSSIILLTSTFPSFSGTAPSQSPAYDHGPLLPPSKQDGPSTNQPSIIDSLLRSVPNRTSVSTASTIDFSSTSVVYQTTKIPSSNTADAIPVLHEAMNQTMTATSMSAPMDNRQHDSSLSSTHMQSANSRSLTSNSLDRFRLRVERSYSLHADFSSRFRSARLSPDTGGGTAAGGAGDTALDMGSIYDKNYIPSSNRNYTPEKGVVDDPSLMPRENSYVSTDSIVILDTNSSISDGKSAVKLQRSGRNAEDRSHWQGDSPVEERKTDPSSSDGIDTRVLTKRLSDAVQMWRNIFVSDVSQTSSPDTMTMNASVSISRTSKMADADTGSNKVKSRSVSIAHHASVDGSSGTMLTAVDDAVMTFDLSTRKMTAKEKEWLEIVRRNKLQIKKAYDDDHNDNNKSPKQELVDSTILSLPPTDHHLLKKTESLRLPLDESEDWSSDQMMMTGQEDRQEVTHSIPAWVEEVADISPSRKMADKEREWMERLKRNKEQSVEGGAVTFSPDVSKKNTVTDSLATRKLSTKEVQWLQIIQSKKDREEAERQEKVRMQREGERPMRSEYDKMKQGLEDLIVHQKKKDRLLLLRQKQSRGSTSMQSRQQSKGSIEEPASQGQHDPWMEEKKREQEEHVSVDAMDREQLEEELRVRELKEEEPRSAAEMMGMVEGGGGGGGGEGLTYEQQASHHGHDRLLPRQAGYYDTASNNSDGLLSVEAKDSGVMSAMKMKSTDVPLIRSERDVEVEPSYGDGDGDGGTAGAGDNDDGDEHDDGAANIVDDGDEDEDGDEQIEGYDESETRDDGKEVAGPHFMLHGEDTHDVGWEGGLNSYDEQRRREWIDVQKARLEMALSQQGEEEQVMYARLEQLEQEKLDYDLRMYEQKQLLRVDLMQSKLDNELKNCHHDGKSEVDRDAVQQMLKASESNSHAELEKMKLNLLVKTKQEVLEQLRILEQQRSKEEYLLREQRRLDGVMADINVKLLQDNNPSSSSSKVVMGGSGQEIWMSSAYGKQGYEGNDGDDDGGDDKDLTVYDGGDDNDDGADGNDDGDHGAVDNDDGDDNNDDVDDNNDDGGDDNYGSGDDIDDGGDDNDDCDNYDERAERNEYGADDEGEDEDVDADERNEYYNDEVNAGDDDAESDVYDDGEEYNPEDVDVDIDDDDRGDEEEYEGDDDYTNQEEGYGDGYEDGDGYEEGEEEEVIDNEGEEYADNIENDEDDRYNDATAADNDAYDDDGYNEANEEDVDYDAGDDVDNGEVGSEEYNAYSEENAFSTEEAGSDVGEDSGIPVRVVRFSDVNSYFYFVADDTEEEEEEYDDGSDDDDDDYNEEDEEEYFEDPDDDDDAARYRTE